MCSSMDVLLPGTLVNHCVRFYGCCLDFALCLKKILLGYFLLNVMDLLGHGTLQYLFAFLLMVLFYFGFSRV
jgi:hypothetical protein